MALFNGTDGDDVLSGGAEDDLILALDGDDTIAGNGGNDIVLGYGGDDTAALNVSTDGEDSSDLGSGADVVNVGANYAGQVRLTFDPALVGDGSIQDTTSFEPGLALRVQGEDAGGTPSGGRSRFDDEGITLVAGAGLFFDVRDLTTGAQLGEAFRAVSLGTAGDDLLTAPLAGLSYYVDGGGGADQLRGGNGSDVLAGGLGDDFFTPSAGLDSVLGGAGFDTVNYGSGVGRGNGALVPDVAAALSRDGAGAATGFRFADGSGTTSWSGVERVIFADGTVDYFTDSLAVGVAHLYRGLLGREADPLGLSYQIDGIEQSGGLRDVADTLAASPEGRAAAAGLSSAAVVERAYAGVLGRAADAGGSAYWTAELDSGRVTAAGMVTTLVGSPEFALGGTGIAARGVAHTEYDAVLIEMAYRTLLGRDVEEAGLIFYNDGIDAGRLPLVGLLELFTQSPEFVAGDGTLSDAAFVDRLYERVLGREGELAGIAYYEGELRVGVPRGVIAEHFLVSPEAGAQRAALAGNGVELF